MPSNTGNLLLDMSTELVESCLTTLRTLPEAAELSYTGLSSVLLGVARMVSGESVEDPLVVVCFAGLPEELKGLGLDSSLPLVDYVHALIERTLTNVQNGEDVGALRAEVQL